MRKTTCDVTTCYRAKGAIETVTVALSASARELAMSTDEAGLRAAQALRAAEQALARARAAVLAAANRPANDGLSLAA